MIPIRIVSVKKEAERERRRQFIADRIAAGDTQEQAFAAWFNNCTAEETDEDLAIARRGSHRIAKIALFSSLLHQVGFFLAAAADYFGQGIHLTHNPMTWVHPASVLIGSFAVPMVIDLTALWLVRKMAMKVASKASRIWCFIALWIPAGASATINFNAPSPHPIFNWGFAGVVIAIPVVYGIRAIWRPDFGQQKKEKEEILAQVATSAAPVKRTVTALTPQQKKARERAGYQTMSRSAQKKYRETEAKKAAALAAKSAAIVAFTEAEDLMADALDETQTVAA